MLLRLAQGIGVGGEWGGAVLLSSEFGDPNKRGFWSSAAQIGPPAGNLMANGVLAVLAASLSTEAFLVLGLARRLPGLGAAGGLRPADPAQAGGNPGLQGHPGARRAAEGPDQGGLHHRNPRALIAAALSRVCPDVLYALFTVFVAVYATKELGMTRGNVLTAILIGSAFQLVPDPAGRRPHGPLQPPAASTASPPSARPSTFRCSS